MPTPNRPTMPQRRKPPRTTTRLPGKKYPRRKAIAPINPEERGKSCPTPIGLIRERHSDPMRKTTLLTPDGVDEAMFEQIRDRLPARLSDYSRQRWTYVLDRFIGYLVKEDAIAAAPQPTSASTALETLCTDYGIWLRTQRGSAPSTIQLRQRKLRHFLIFRFNDAAPGDLSAITRADIVAYLGVRVRQEITAWH